MHTAPRWSLCSNAKLILLSSIKIFIIFTIWGSLRFLLRENCRKKLHSVSDWWSFCLAVRQEWKANLRIPWVVPAEHWGTGKSRVKGRVLAGALPASYETRPPGQPEGSPPNHCKSQAEVLASERKSCMKIACALDRAFKKVHFIGVTYKLLLKPCQ